MAFQHFGSAIFLIIATSFIHGAGTLVLFWTLFRSRIFATCHFGPLLNAGLLTVVVVALLAVHLTEAACWAAFYTYKGCFADFDTSLYFSMITYTTVGYGDVILRGDEWRLLAGVEALTGSLMLCWSTVVLVHVLTKIYQRRREIWEEEESLTHGRVYRPDRPR
jgi:voltage-gated potassium channel Kch